MNLKQALEANRGVGPGFHLMRHALSFAIVLFHCRTAVYWTASAEQVATGAREATTINSLVSSSVMSFENLTRPFVVALLATFFALSGFLVTGSAVRTGSVRQFFANRALRIFPALSVEVTLSALILGVVFTTLPLSQYFTSYEFFRYFGNIVGFVSFTLPGVFENLPWPNIVNGNLWTLPPEFWCYALMMVVMVVGLMSRRQVLLILVAATVVVATVVNFVDPQILPVRGPNFFLPWYIVLMFWLGAVMFLYSEWIPLRFDLFVFSALFYYVTILFGFAAPLASVALAYCMVYLGMVSVPWWDRLLKSDLSYGTYLYGFPIMQAWMAVLLPFFDSGVSLKVQTVILFALTLSTTICFAALSWRFIEKPTLALRKVFLKVET